MKLTVYGVPAPQGSKTRMPNGAMLESGSKVGRAKHKAWRAAVTETAAAQWDGRPPLDGPLALTLHLRFAMPASRPAAVRVRGWAPHTVKPDKDKVLRTTLDALKDAGVIRDDARVCDIRVEAREVIGWTGCELEVRRLDP